MTVEEAEAMVCPMAQGAEYSKRCATTNCMAWRWATPDPVDGSERTDGLCGMVVTGGYDK